MQPQLNADYEVGGTISGLLSSGLVLQDNGGDDLTIAVNSTSFTFPANMAYDEGYNVTVKTQPETQICQVTRGSGNISGGSVTNIIVTCAPYVLFSVSKKCAERPQ